jgi:hypothetical protein
MDFDLDQRCDIHPQRHECPDNIVDIVRGGYGLIVHDGGSSVIEISYCPWCGTKLPPIADLDSGDYPDSDDDPSDTKADVPGVRKLTSF